MKKVLVILLAAFIMIQFFPIDKTNPPTNKGMDFLRIKETPDNIATVIRSSCYDCHSNETKYPWYSNIQPFGWFLKDHIEEGRKELNFSIFATYEPKRQVKKMKEAAKQIEKGEMPLDSYLLNHSEAVLDEADKKMLIQYFKEIQAQTKTSDIMSTSDS